MRVKWIMPLRMMYLLYDWVSPARTDISICVFHSTHIPFLASIIGKRIQKKYERSRDTKKTNVNDMWWDLVCAADADRIQTEGEAKKERRTTKSFIFGSFVTNVLLSDSMNIHLIAIMWRRICINQQHFDQKMTKKHSQLSEIPADWKHFRRRTMNNSYLSVSNAFTYGSQCALQTMSTNNIWWQQNRIEWNAAKCATSGFALCTFSSA